MATQNYLRHTTITNTFTYSPNNIKILQHNVAHWRPYKQLLTQTYADINPDILLINSHGLKDEETLKIHGYTTYQKNSSNELHDGSAILIKTNIKHRVTENFLTDILFITIETNIGPVNIATTYLPPRRPYLPIPDFHQLASHTFPTYIIGDLNAKHQIFGDNYCNTVGRGLKMLIDNNKLKHLGPDFPTLITQNTNTTPDIILSNTKTYHNHIIEAGPVTISDHLPLILTITAKAIKIPSTPKFNYSKANWEKFKDSVQNNIHEAIPSRNSGAEEIDKAIETWYNIIIKAMQGNIPKTNTQVTHKPITNNTIRHIQTMLATLRQTATMAGWTHEKYRQFNSLKQNLIEECKTQNNINWTIKINKLATLYKQPRDFWRNIRLLKGNKTNESPYIIHNNIKIYSDKGKSEVFKSIWSEIFKISPEENASFDPQNEMIVNNFIHENKNLIEPHQNANIDRLDATNPLTTKISTQEVLTTIKTFKNNTPGTSNINKTILMQLPIEAIEIFTQILNLSLSMGYFPTKFKHATIKLIPKPNKATTNPINFRPISLLEVPSKVYEKIINKRLSRHLEQGKLLPSSQHGFRPARGTDTALAITSEKIANSLNNKNQCYIVLRDVAKAFDKVWHKGLKYKLISIQLPDITTKLISTFLNNRTASIKVNEYTGAPFNIQSGVPQGSALSPTLYSIYTSDIPQARHGCLNIMYADDVTQIITHPSKSRNFMVNKIQKEINTINTYEKKWKIKTNMSKFKVIPLAIRKTKPIHIEGNLIQYSNEGNILGMHINKTGYKHQAKHNKNKATLALNLLRRFHALSPNIKLHLIKACVLPILTYPSYPLNTLSKTSMLSLQRIQNKAIRFALEDSKYPYAYTTEQLHNMTNIKPINITIHERGIQTKERLINIVQDETYTELISNECDKEHGWFKRPIRHITTIPNPVYT